jgi:hypothetical protein
MGARKRQVQNVKILKKLSFGIFDDYHPHPNITTVELPLDCSEK